jgi:hypothetical protein
MQNRLTSLAFVAALIVSIFALVIFFYLPTQATAAQNNGNGDGNGNGADRVETIDDLFAKVAKQHPGFGGMFINEEKGITHVFLRHGNAKEVVKDLEDVLDQDLPNRAKALPAKYTFLKLRQWHDRLAPQVLKIREVTLTDIDDRRNRLTVGVENSQASARVERQVAELDIPEGAVKIVKTGPIKLINSLTDRHRPLVGGLQIEGSAVFGIVRAQCTLGFIALSEKAAEAEPVREPEEGFVTAAHCSDKPGAVDGTTYYQPTRDGTNQIGVERLDPKGNPCKFRGVRIPGITCRRSDANFSEIEEAPGAEVVNVNLGFIARPDLNSTKWDGNSTFRITGEDVSTVGMKVTKVGASTGRTQGEVTRVGVNNKVSPLFALRGILLRDQVAATFDADSGDSGGPVISAQAPDPGQNPVDTSLLGTVNSRTGGGGFGGNPQTLYSTIQSEEAELGPLNTCAPAVGPC